MASIPNDLALSISEAEPPFASYAQIVRMLVPLAGKIAFYSEKGDALWISDGVEEPGLRARVDALLTPAAAPPQAQSGVEPIYLLPIRDPRRRLRGLLAIVYRDDRSERGLSTIERLLAPLIEILSHAWSRESGRVKPASTAPLRLAAVQSQAPSAPVATPWPALLRHALLIAAQRVECAFGAVVATERAFTLSHRVSPEVSDLEIEAAIGTVSPHMCKLMKARREAVVANRVAADRARAAPFKFIVYPIRSPEDQLLAILILFRASNGRDFVRWDIEALKDVCADLNVDALAELAPSKPEPAKRPATSAAPAPITMEARLRAALEADAFDLHIQQISPLRQADRPARYEVLLRLRDAGRLWPPRAFLSAAETAGLMTDLDRWVVRRLLQTLRENAGQVRSAGLEFCINVSRASLTSAAVREFIVAEVCRSSIPPGLLVFEVAEAQALNHHDAVETLAARLRDVGCRLALDNCRAGFETLSSVRNWPVSCVKLDGALVRNLTGNPRSESLVRAVVQLAAGAGVETVGQGVETIEVCERLLDIGVDFAQGFHFSQPQPLARLFA